MKTEKQNLHEIVRKIKSPYDNIAEQMKADLSMVELLKNNPDLGKYDLSKMIPKVTYDKWSICLYEDNKLYYIDHEEIVEVIPVRIATFDEKYNIAIAESGQVLTEIEDFYNYGSSSSYCGQSDDMKYYIAFDRID